MRLIGAAVAWLSVGIAGCSFGSDRCDKIEEYETSVEITPLKVPPDLDAPDRSGQFVIPGEAVADAEPPPNEPCLEQPPDYFDKKL